MAEGALERLCQLGVEGRLTEATALISQELGAGELELLQPDRWGQLDLAESSPTHWQHPLRRKGRVLGVLRGAGAAPAGEAAARLERLGRALALALPEPLPVLALMALEAGGDGFWTVDLESGAFSCTERFRGLLGDGAEPFGPAEVLLPEDRRRFQRELATALEGAAAGFQGLYRVRRGERSPGTLRYRTTILRRLDGSATRLVGVVSDISDEEEARAHLEAQGEELRQRTSVSTQLAELANRLIHAEGAEEVEALGSAAFASLLGVAEAGVLRPVGTDWELKVPRRGAVRSLGALPAGPLAELLAGQEPVREWSPDREGDPLSRELSALGYPAVAAFALDAGAERLGAILALSPRTEVLRPEQRVTGAQLAVMLAVTLARLEDRARLRSGQRQLEEALKLTRSGSWDYEVRTDRVHWSRALSELNGLPAVERVMTRQESVALTEPDDLEVQGRAFATLVTRGGEQTWLTRVRLSDGRRQHRRNTAVAERSPQGALTRVSGVSSDVTAEVEAQASLEQALAQARRYQTLLERSEALLRRAGALAHVGGWEYEVATDTLVWNEETRNIHQVDAGFSPSLEVWLLFYEGSSRSLMGRALRGCVEEGAAFDLELKLTTARGAEVWVRAQGQAERAEGRSVRMVGAFQDITQQREAREAVLQASRAKSQFLANTSHEIRTPLNGILGMTQLALETTGTLEQREYLEAVATSGQNLLSIVNDILDISKIESGKLDLESVPVVLERLVHEAVRNLIPRAHARQVEVVVITDPRLAQPLPGDPVRLGQIVTNLVGNAVKFTEVGEVVVEAQLVGPELVLSVRDTGVGIPADRLGAIFEAFTQGDGSISRRFGGTGLGLTITRELVTRMGGTLSVESAVGVGTTFTARLPLPARRALGPAPRRDGPVPRVLVVEAHPLTREALCGMLEHLGAEAVAPPASGAAMPLLLEAWDQGRPFQLLVAGLQLEGSTGLQLFEALGHHPGLEDLPRLLLTSTTQRPDPVTLARLRVRRALTRPVAPWELAEALASLGPGLPAPEPAAPEQRPGLPRSLKVLLAEDNAINARLAVRLLEKLGHAVTHVVDGEAAVVATGETDFEVVLMDLQMPRLDGLEATRRIRARERDTGGRLPIIALTANAMKGDDALCLDAGMDAYLTKPINVERLREALSDLPRPRARARLALS